MDPTVPKAAARILNFIGNIEAPDDIKFGFSGYDVLYGNAQRKYSWRLTQLTVSNVLAKGLAWPSAHGSSACGRYQFMAGKNHTLAGLYEELRLRPGQVFDPNLQDRLAYHLLIRRQYAPFTEGRISSTAFGKQLAQEWASMPVLAATKGQKRWVLRGQSYYAGDNLNKSLTKPERLEAVLVAALADHKGQPAPQRLQEAAKGATTKSAGQAAGAATTGAGGLAGGSVLDVTTFDWTAWLFAGGIAAVIAALTIYFVLSAVKNNKRSRAFKELTVEESRE